MKDKSLEMLEFPRIREMVAGYTAFAISRELALAMHPSTDSAHILRLLKQSAEARHLLSIEPDSSIGGIFDVREAVTLAARGKTLELETLVDSYGGVCLPSAAQPLLVFADHHWARRCQLLLVKRGVASHRCGCHLQLPQLW